MEVVSNIEKDLVQAQKAKDELATLVLRQLKTSIANAGIANNRQALSDEQLTKILRSEVKKRREAADLYKKGGREELVAKENAEIEIIEKYLPAAMDENQVRAKVKEVIEKTGASSVSEMGKIMALAMKELGAAADGTMVSSIVKQELSSK